MPWIELMNDDFFYAVKNKKNGDDECLEFLYHPTD